MLAAACAGSSPTDLPPPQSTLGPLTENVGIVVSEDETILRGHLFGAENQPGVILSHMRPNDQRDWFDFARELADQGYAALTFDFRGYGETDGDKDFSKLDEDLSAAVRFMRDRGKQPIFLIGASMGGTASLVVAAEQSVDGVIAISAPAKFEDQDALDAIAAVTEPTLLIASEDDTAAIISLDELVEAASGPKEREIYTGNAHGTDLLDSENAAAFRERIFRFLREARGP
jgi:alpha-beta hydrolase superfamily lysophospholipase